MIEPDVKVVLVLSNFGFCQVVECAAAAEIRVRPEFDQAHGQRVEQAGWNNVDWQPRVVITKRHPAQAGWTPAVFSSETSVEQLPCICELAVAIIYPGVGRVVD